MLSCISVFLFVVFDIGYPYWPQMNTFLISFEPSCTVGIIRTSATVTIQGWQATQDYDNLFSGQQAPNAPKIDTSKIYRLDSPPDAPVVCQFDDPMSARTPNPPSPVSIIQHLVVISARCVVHL